VLATAMPAWAQSASDSGGWTPEIIVTGKRVDAYSETEAGVLRTSVPIVDTLQSIQVLTRQLLDDQEITTLEEGLNNVSGVVSSLASETLLGNPVIRGFEAEIFVDGLIG
jgi:iron complex outermembrane recepter protein